MTWEWVAAAAPGLVVALAAGLFQHARVPTLNRRIERHVKLRADLDGDERDALNQLLRDEINALVKRDRAWLSPKNLAAALIRRIATFLAAAVALSGAVYALFIQSREDRLESGNYGELWSVAGIGVLFVGYWIAWILDGVAPGRAMFGGAAATGAAAEPPENNPGDGTSS